MTGWERARLDYFAKIPYRVNDALIRRELTFDQYGVLVFLQVEAERRRSREVAFSLRALVDAIGWGKDDETLRRVLVALRDGGWIAFESKPGQRKPYVFRLVRAAIDGHGEPTSSPPPRDPLADDPSHEEVTSAARRSENAASPLVERESAAPEPPARGGAREEKEMEQGVKLTTLASLPPPSAFAAGRDEGERVEEGDLLVDEPDYIRRAREALERRAGSAS